MSTSENCLDNIDENFDERLEISRQISWKRFGKRIRFYAPTFADYRTVDTSFSSSTFPSLSVTGTDCSLNCLHCRSKLLNTMIPVKTPALLLDEAYRLKEQGSLGFLLSGGCLPNGAVPIKPFLDTIRRIKNELNLTVFVHTGLIDIETAREMRLCGVDGALIDVIGSDKTIRQIYNLKDVTVQDYENSLEALNQSGIPTIPHILLGLDYGRLKGEIQALKIISKHIPSALVIIVLRPLPGTPMEKVSPPTPREVAEFIITSRITLKEIPIVLGCVRPLGRHRLETDRLAVMAGINGIVFPSTRAFETAEALGVQTSFSGYCCARIYLDVDTP